MHCAECYQNLSDSNSAAEWIFRCRHGWKSSAAAAAAANMLLSLRNWYRQGVGSEVYYRWLPVIPVQAGLPVQKQCGRYLKSSFVILYTTTSITSCVYSWVQHMTACKDFSDCLHRYPQIIYTGIIYSIWASLKMSCLLIYYKPTEYNGLINLGLY